MAKPITTVLSATLFAIVAAFSGPSMAETVTISKMTYKNNGAYDATFLVRYNMDDGTNCTVFQWANSDTGAEPGAVPFIIKSDNKVQVDLTEPKFLMWKGPERCLTDKTIPDGMRVWGRIEIGAGDNVSCKKSIVLLKGADGRRMDYHSGGTTLNNNRCKQSLN